MIRFVAVNSKLDVRSGVFGIASEFGRGAERIAEATRLLMKEFSTKNIGSSRSVLIKPLHAAIIDKLHMITVDSASDEVH